MHLNVLGVAYTCKHTYTQTHTHTVTLLLSLSVCACSMSLFLSLCVCLSVCISLPPSLPLSVSLPLSLQPPPPPSLSPPLPQANYHWLFYKHELTHRADTIGATLTHSGKSLLKWTKTEPFIHMTPERALQQLVAHMATRGYTVPDDIPPNTRCLALPRTTQERQAILQFWGDMEHFHWYKAAKYVETPA